MSITTQDSNASNALEAARVLALSTGLAYAGGVSPPAAWVLFSSGQAVLVDVRSAEERSFVGYVPGSLHVAWATGTGLTRNPRWRRRLRPRPASRASSTCWKVSKGNSTNAGSAAAVTAGAGIGCPGYRIDSR